MQLGETLGGESRVARATKKVHRREDDPPDVGDMEVDEGRAKVVSFKYKLLGWVSNDNQDEDFHEDKFELIEGDVITGLADGIPNIKFSEKVHMWNQRIFNSTTMGIVLQYFYELSKTLSGLDSAPGFLGFLLQKMSLGGGGKLDRLSDQGRLQRVEFEGLPNVCFGCGYYGHQKKVCPKLRKENPPMDQEHEVTVLKSLAMTELNRRAKTGEFGSWMVVLRQSRCPRRRNAKMETNQQKMNNGSRFSLIADLNEESGDGTAGNMDGKSSSTINAIMPRLGFSLGEASGLSLSRSKNKRKELQGSGLRKKRLNGVKFGSSGPQQKVKTKKITEEKGNHMVVVVEENWELNIMVVEGESMSNKSGLKFLEGGPSSSISPEPSTVKWVKFRDQNHHRLRNKKKVDAMMSVVDLVENIFEQIGSAIRNIEVPREDGMELLEAEDEEGNFQAKC
ncbi:hypothetical protein Gogos_017194 [Gossypium gossypioides]|uniref:CCHC-type domain-containing protein n=1 Tax=Gossypium gossypioides TaxID=34282 RepID=A0A7J9BA38_GOSGO|nr:hypothetical protein [Gossypium gossypioides]